MTESNTIVVAVDPASPPEDLTPVLAMAVGAGWSIELVHAMTVPGGDGTGKPPPVVTQLEVAEGTDWDGADAQERHLVSDQLADLAKPLLEHPVEVRTHVLYGPPVDVLLTAAEVLKAAMIVVTGDRQAQQDRTVLGSVVSSLLKVADRPVLVLPVGDREPDPGFVAAVDRLVELIDREGDDTPLTDLRAAAAAQLKTPDSEEERSNLGDRLVDALHRFETTHPNLTKAINDVSYHLSGLGI